MLIWFRVLVVNTRWIVVTSVAPIFRGWLGSVNGCHVARQRWRGRVSWLSIFGACQTRRMFMTCSIEHESASVKVSQQRSSKGYKSLSILARIPQARRQQTRDWVKLGKHDEGNSVRVLGIGQRNPRLDQARIRLFKRDKNLFQRDQDSLGIDVWARLHAYNLRDKYHN